MKLNINLIFVLKMLYNIDLRRGSEDRNSSDPLTTVLQDIHRVLSTFSHTIALLWYKLHVIFGWPIPESILKKFDNRILINRFKDTSHPLHWKTIQHLIKDISKMKEYLLQLLKNPKYTDSMLILGFSI